MGRLPARTVVAHGRGAFSGANVQGDRQADVYARKDPCNNLN